MTTYGLADSQHDWQQQSVFHLLSLKWEINTVYTVELSLKPDCIGNSKCCGRFCQGRSPEVMSLWRRHNTCSESTLNRWLHVFPMIKAASWHLQATSQKGENRALVFQSTWLSNKGIPPLKICWKQQKPYTASVVELQWLNLCGWTRLQSFSLKSLKPTTISGLGFWFENLHVQSQNTD